MTPAELLGVSDERDMWERRLQAAARAAYAVGYAHGRADEARDSDRAWAARPVGRRPAANEPTLAELELLRWGPGGREHFGDPRPGDYQGQPRQESAA